MTQNDYAKQFFANNIEIMKRKNHDYSGYADDPFSNFKSVLLVGVEPIDGFLTRMMDKIARIKTLLKKGKLLVADESIKDTLADLANYAMLLAGYIDQINTREQLLDHAIKFFGCSMMGTANLDLEKTLIAVSESHDDHTTWGYLIELAHAAMETAYKYEDSDSDN